MIGILNKKGCSGLDTFLPRVRNGNLSESTPRNLDERGTVDAGLTLIPLTIFFLLIVQLVLAGQKQISEAYFLHNLVIRSQISESSNLAKVDPDNIGKDRELKVNSEAVERVGLIRSYEMRSKVPIIGAFIEWIGGEVFLSNTVISVE